MPAKQGTFFTKDKTFYKALFGMLIIVALQNLVSYSVNMVDNIMLGRYSQDALSGATTVNQIFFMVDQFALSIGNALVALASQYWGEKRVDPIRRLTGIALRLGLIVGIVIIAICAVAPVPVIHIFTNDAGITSEAAKYLFYIQWTFILFILSNILMAVLRAVGTVRISFYISVVSLGINTVLDYAMIYGHLGFPRMGVEGAAIATLISRIVEFLIVVIFLLKADTKLHLFCRELFHVDKPLRKDYTKVYLPIMVSQVFWGVSVPFQTAILGHLSADAIAANSVATTFYTYLKVVILAMSATSAAMIGQSIGRGDIERVKSDGRTMAVIDVVIGLILAALLALLSKPLLSLYTLNDNTMTIAYHLLIILSFVMIGMSYQMPVSFGIIQGAGNGEFTMKMNLISTWCIVMPLSFMAAFWWKLPVELVVICIQSDQIFKGLPTFIKFRSYTWIRHLTRADA
ncbi:MAG: MATE family efflux transporter [Eubacterium sp.]|jgi:putative MATE family efflux protein